MVDEVDGTSERQAGGLAPDAVAPEASEHIPLAGVCLNCGATLIGAYCHDCGQKARVHRTLRAFGHDLAHSVLHFEGRIWRTLPLLAWRPGTLTRRYVEGQRASFVSPMALFLFSVFLMFAMVSTLGGPFAPGMQADPVAQVQLRAEETNARKRLAQLESERKALVAKGGDPDAIDSRIADARAEAGAIGAISAVQPGLPQDLRIEGFGEDGDAWLNGLYAKARANPSLLVYKIQNNAYKFSWALIPISVPFLWLLFLFRPRYKLYDHSIFVTYSMAFMTLLAVGLSLLRAIGVSSGWIVSALTFIPPIHMYRQLRGAYQLSRFAAAWRALSLAVFAGVAALIFLLLLLAIGIM